MGFFDFLKSGSNSSTLSIISNTESEKAAEPEKNSLFKGDLAMLNVKEDEKKTEKPEKTKEMQKPQEEEIPVIYNIVNEDSEDSEVFLSFSSDVKSVWNCSVCGTDNANDLKDCAVCGFKK